MGIIADTMAEVVDRTQNTMEGAATVLRTATTVDLIADGTGNVVVNVDGQMILHVIYVTTASATIVNPAEFVEGDADISSAPVKDTL